MAWCRQATSHYLSQCWPRSLSPYGVTRPQWVNLLGRLASHFQVVKSWGLPLIFQSLSFSAIWWWRSGSTLAQVMACCLHQAATTWTNVDSSVRFNDNDLRAISFIRNNSRHQLPKLAWNYLSKFLFKSPRGKWVKCTDGCENYRSCMSPQTTKLLIWPLCEEISGHKYLFFILDDGMLSSIH